MNARALVIAALFGAAGCGGTDGGTNMPPANMGTRSGYPAGPFGTTENAIVANHEFVNVDGSKFSLGDVYKEKKNKLLVVSTTAEWCSACIEEQPVLKERHNRWSNKGLFVVVAIFQKMNTDPADAAAAEKWKRRFELPFAVVADPPFVWKDYYDETLTPMNMVVDVETMKILRLWTGADTSALDAIIEAKL